MNEPHGSRSTIGEPGRTSRRTFLRAGVTAGGIAAASGPWARGALGALFQDQPNCDFPQPPGGSEPRANPYAFPSPAPLRTRRCLHEVVADPNALQQLARAYQALKGLQNQPDNPLNWCNQANIHYNHCSLQGVSNYYLQIHYGWLFLPWHRAYLYFYETILGSLINDPSFALPFWDWTNNPTVPSVFFDPSSPLYDPNRAIVNGQSIADDPEVYSVTNQDFYNYLMSLPTYSPPANSPLAPSFGGPPDDTEASSQYQGQLEGGPHDAVHSWVGGDMGSFDTAARDLLFFGHHANVDRLWALWLQGTGHQNPVTSATWMGTWFDFWAPNGNGGGSPVSVTVADTLNPQAMNVVYQSCQAPRPAVAAAAAPPEGGRAGGERPRPRFVREGPPVTLDAAVKTRERLAAEAAVARPAGGEVLLEGVATPPRPGVRLRVFLNKPDASETTSLDDPHYVGTVFLVPMRAERGEAAAGHAMPMHTHNYSLKIPERALAGLKEGEAPKVTIVPIRAGDRGSDLALKVKAAHLVRPR